MLVTTRLSASLALVLAGVYVQAAEPPRVAGFTYVQSLAGIHEYRLDANGLDVLLKEDRSAPVVTFQVTYRVGSRNEVTGTTGATHLLEHLMFKGSDNHNDSAGTSIKQYVESVGGQYNATTWLDRTNYYATLGKDQLEGYVAIEADRMRHLWLREEDRRSEMTVVRNEYERGQNSPIQALAEEVTATAYQASPYHHPTIGWRSDIEHVPIERLRDFYDTYYWPDNAAVTIVGDVEPRAALALVRKYYGSIPRAPKPIPQLYTDEPNQTGARRVIVKRPAQLGALLIAHKVPNALAADTPALEVLDAILSEGKTSRLYRALIDSSVATAASAEHSHGRDLSLNQIFVRLAPEIEPEIAERAILSELERLRRDPVSALELAAAKRQLHASLIFERDTASGVAAALNEWIAAGDWTQYVRFPDLIERVTVADVQRVARLYLNDDQSTTGWFVPITERSGRQQ
jgi:zinc protease